MSPVTGRADVILSRGVKLRKGKTIPPELRHKPIHYNQLLTLKFRENFTQRAPADEAHAPKAPAG
jgi:hypothetical protein